MRLLLIAVLTAGCGSLDAGGTGGSGGATGGAGGSGGAGGVGDAPTSDAPMGDGSPNDGGGTGGTGGAGGSGGSSGDGGMPTCMATITAVGGPFVDGDNVVLLAAVTGQGTPTSFQWQSSQGTVPSQSAMATLMTNGTGAYNVSVMVTTDAGASCIGMLIVNVGDRNPSYVRLRVTPSGSGALPRQVFRFLPSQAAQAQDLLMQTGTPNALSIRSNGSSVAGYIRLSDPDTCVPIEVYPTPTQDAVVNLLPTTFDALVMPADSQLAPFVFRNQIAPLLPFGVLPGGAVIGHVLLADNTPVADAHIELLGGLLPSSIATTRASDGAFEAHTWATSSALDIVVAPPDSSLPIAQSATAPIPATGGATPSVLFQYDPTTPAHVSGDVTLPGGGLAVGAHLTFVARNRFPRVGQVTVNGGAPVAVGGTARAEAVTTTTSHFGPVALPPALYDVLIEPPNGLLVARMRTTVDLTAGDQNMSWRLGGLVPLTGHITDSSGQPVPCIVRAVEHGATAIFTTPMPQSTYTLNVDPDTGYDVYATPVDLNTMLARGGGTTGVTQAGADFPIVLSAGTAFSGHVRGPNGPLAGALVEALPGAYCGVGRNVVADTISAADGTYRIVVPVP